MATGTRTSDVIFALQNEQGNACVSVIVPTHRTSPDRRADRLVLTKAIKKAGQLLKAEYSADLSALLMNKLDKLFQQIDFDHNEDGLGLYVSKNIQLIVSFPFPVKEKVVAGDSFQIRDVLYKENYSEPYYVLLLAENSAQLYHGSWTELEEIKDKNFPMEYEEEYSYDPPGRNMSFSGQFHIKSLEKDKSKLKTTRYKRFFQNVDKLLNGFLVNDEPLIIAGADRLSALFESVSTHEKNIARKITGSYGSHSLKQLSDLVSMVIFGHLQYKRAELIEEFIRKYGQGLATSGIQDVWSTAMEGKAFKLLVEKDYHKQGFLDESRYHLSLRPPQKPHTVLTDAVDDLIELVLKKDGKVFFVDNESLKDYQRIALITRY